MQRKNQYRRVIELALSMPEYEPPTIEPVTVKKPTRQKIKDALTRRMTIRAGAERAYNLLVSAARGHITLSDRVPADQLHREMAIHINRLTAEAIMYGGLPLSIHVFDRFLCYLDFGKGRTLKLHTQLHQQPKSQSLASFIVEEQADADLSIFDQVPHIDYKKEQPTIISAQVWSADIAPEENNKRKTP